VPQLSVLTQAISLFKNGGQGGMMANIGTAVNIATMAGNAFGFNPFGGGSNGTSQGGIGGIISQFVNNVPQ
jgi:hypothetical protein